MENNPLISVLMGIYNCADTLEEAVMSIKNQTYDNWELIMCDDCSDDNTFEAAKKLCEQDKRLTLIKNDKNLGLAQTLNNCLELANGEFIARMDGDDVCDSTRFEKEALILINHPEYAVVSCNMLTYDEKGVHGTVKYKENPVKRDFINSSPFCHAGCMMRKAVLTELGGYDISKNNERIEDYDLWTRLYAKGYIGYNINEPLYSMRDDRNAFNRRKFKYRINEFKLKMRICKLFDLPFLCGISAFKPIIVGLMPGFLYKYLHRKKLSD